MSSNDDDAAEYYSDDLLEEESMHSKHSHDSSKSKHSTTKPLSQKSSKKALISDTPKSPSSNQPPLQDSNLKNTEEEEEAQKPTNKEDKEDKENQQDKEDQLEELEELIEDVLEEERKANCPILPAQTQNKAMQANNPPSNQSTARRASSKSNQSKFSGLATIVAKPDPLIHGGRDGLSGQDDVGRDPNFGFAQEQFGVAPLEREKEKEEVKQENMFPDIVSKDPGIGADERMREKSMPGNQDFRIQKTPDVLPPISTHSSARREQNKPEQNENLQHDEEQEKILRFMKQYKQKLAEFKQIKLQIKLKKSLLQSLSTDPQFMKLNVDQQMEVLEDEIVARDSQIVNLNQMLTKTNGKLRQILAEPQKRVVNKNARAKILELEQRTKKFEIMNLQNEKKAQKLMAEDTKQILVLQKKLNELEDESKAAKTRVLDLEAAVDSKDQEIFSQIEQICFAENSAKKMEEEKLEYEQQLSSYTAQCEVLENDKFEQELKLKEYLNFEQDLQDAQDEIKKLLEKKEVTDAENIVMQEYKEKYSEISSSLTSLIKESESKLDSLTEQITAKINQKIELENAKIQEEVSLKEKEVAKELQRIEKKNKEIKGLSEKLSAKEKDLSAESENLSKKDKDLFAERKRLKEWEKEIQKLKKEAMKEKEQFLIMKKKEAKERIRIKQEEENKKKEKDLVEKEPEKEQDLNEGVKNAKNESMSLINLFGKLAVGELLCFSGINLESKDKLHSVQISVPEKKPSSPQIEKEEKVEDVKLKEEEKDEEEEDDDEEEEEEEEEEKEKPEEKASPKAKTESSEDEEEEDDDEDDEKDKSKKSSESEGEDDDEDDDDEDSEEDTVKKKKDSDKDSDESDEEDSDDEHKSKKSKASNESDNSDEDDSEDEKEKKATEASKPEEESEPEIELTDSQKLDLFHQEKAALETEAKALLEQLKSIELKMDFSTEEADSFKDTKTPSSPGKDYRKLKDELEEKERRILQMNTRVFEIEALIRAKDREVTKLQGVNRIYKTRLQDQTAKLNQARIDKSHEVIAYQNKLNNKEKIFIDLKNKIKNFHNQSLKAKAVQSQAASKIALYEKKAKDAQKNLILANKKILNYEAILRENFKTKEKFTEEKEVFLDTFKTREQKLKKMTIKVSCLEEELYKRENTIVQKEAIMSKFVKKNQSLEKEVTKLNKKIKQLIEDTESTDKGNTTSSSMIRNYSLSSAVRKPRKKITYE